jgi:hypothetical protein
MSEVTSIDESAGDLQPIAEIIAAAIIAAASRSQMLLPFPTRLARLGRELRARHSGRCWSGQPRLRVL